MEMLWVFIFAFIMGCVFTDKHWQTKMESWQPPPLEYIDFVKLQEIIDRMNETKERLQTIERMLLDMQIADEEQTMKVVWDDATSKGNRYTFGMTADNPHLVRAVKEERAKLRTSLLEDVRDIERLRSGQNGGTNDEENRQGREAA